MIIMSRRETLTKGRKISDINFILLSVGRPVKPILVYYLSAIKCRLVDYASIVC